MTTMTIIRTSFVDFNTGETTIGCRIYDSENCTYISDMTYEQMILPDVDFFKLIVDNYSDDIISNMIEFDDNVDIDGVEYKINTDGTLVEEA